MSVYLFNSRERETFAEARAELAIAATMGLAPSERTLAVQLLAGTFVDALSDSQPGGDAQLLSWIDKMCDTYGDQPAVTKFMSSACTSLESFLANHGASERERGALRKLEPKIDAVARKPRSGPPSAPERLDETDALINQLVWRLDHADPLTAEHSRAVAAWSARIARRLTLAEQEVVFASRCGMIHDIGKITTPPQILNAPRKLTPEEWVVMRQHTINGYEIAVFEGAALEEFTTAIRSHHERLDGRGYPDSRERDAIPLATRIVSVADSFNAMIGRRPYRPALPVSLAIEELQRHSGTQFDPEVVAAMLAVVGLR